MCLVRLRGVFEPLAALSAERLAEERQHGTVRGERVMARAGGIVRGEIDAESVAQVRALDRQTVTLLARVERGVALQHDNVEALPLQRERRRRAADAAAGDDDRPARRVFVFDKRTSRPVLDRRGIRGRVPDARVSDGHERVVRTKTRNTPASCVFHAPQHVSRVAGFGKRPLQVIQLLVPERRAVVRVEPGRSVEDRGDARPERPEQVPVRLRAQRTGVRERPRRRSELHRARADARARGGARQSLRHGSERNVGGRFGRFRVRRFGLAAARRPDQRGDVRGGERVRVRARLDRRAHGREQRLRAARRQLGVRPGGVHQVLVVEALQSRIRRLDAEQKRVEQRVVGVARLGERPDGVRDVPRRHGRTIRSRSIVVDGGASRQRARDAGKQVSPARLVAGARLGVRPGDVRQRPRVEGVSRAHRRRDARERREESLVEEVQAGERPAGRRDVARAESRWGVVLREGILRDVSRYARRRLRRQKARRFGEGVRNPPLVRTRWSPSVRLRQSAGQDAHAARVERRQTVRRGRRQRLDGSRHVFGEGNVYTGVRRGVAFVVVFAVVF